MVATVTELGVVADRTRSGVVAATSVGVSLICMSYIAFHANNPPVLVAVTSAATVGFGVTLAVLYAGYREAAVRLLLVTGTLGCLAVHAVGLDDGTSMIPYLLINILLAATLMRSRDAALLDVVIVVAGVAVEVNRTLHTPGALWLSVASAALVLVLAAVLTVLRSFYNENVQDALQARLGEIEVVLDRAKRVAVGDLSWDVQGDGDVADTLRLMNRGLRDLVDRIQRGAHSLGAASSQLAAMAAEQERTSLELAGGFEEIQRTLSGFNESSSKIADHTRKVADVASQTVETNHRIDEQLRGLASQTERIKDILATINGIANKSDLLALNASLEAVRAGDAGRGFALVAGQMQKLAESVVASVDDIRTLTSDIRSASAASLGSSAQAALLAETTSTRAEEISLITQQQRSATGAVVEAVRDISEYTRQSSEASAEGSASVRDLQVLADDLRGLVARFSLGGPAVAARAAM